MIKDFPYIVLLQGPVVLLEDYLKGHLPKADALRRAVFLEMRHSNCNPQPDYVFRNVEDLAFSASGESMGKMLALAISKLSKEYLYRQGDNLYVHNEKFNEWQEVITRIPPLLLISGLIANDPLLDTKSQARFFTLNCNKTALPSPRIPVLESALSPGPAECHLHLNGTTEMDVLWLKILTHPLSFARSLSQALRKPPVREQYLQIDINASPIRFYYCIELARILRGELVRRLLNRPPLFSHWPSPEKGDRDIPLTSGEIHPATLLTPKCIGSDLAQEGYLLARLISRLPYASQTDIHFFYEYLLLKGYINRFVVQQPEQWGFDQFQKITLNDQRDFWECCGYEERFRQLEGMIPAACPSRLEGRFSPRNTPMKNLLLIQKIIGDFLKYQKKCKKNGSNHSIRELSLIAHFIKNPPADATPYWQYRQLRRNLKKQARSLAYLRDEIPQVRSYLAGFDAAANELHAPPEIFAPVYRYLRNRGFTHFTYHVGEDFIHLVSGIRAVYESIEYLDLQPGDRIGHATALGISPSLWRQRCCQGIVLRKGEWLDNLLWASSLIHDIFSLEMEQEAQKYIAALYPRSKPDIPTYLRAKKLRMLDPEILFEGGCFSCSPPRFRLSLKYNRFSPYEYEEWDRIAELFQSDPAAIQVLAEYHSPEYEKRSNELQEIPCDARIFPEKILQQLQQITLEKLAERQISIEILPTSNLRISYYQTMEEHHIRNWITEKGTAPLMILGSDDPGIFATNLYNEYAHVYELLRKQGTPSQEAGKICKWISKNAETHIFKITKA